MKVKTVFLLVAILTTATLAQAQLKVSLTSGISQSISSKPDSLFFAKKTGLMTQVNMAYYMGRIGIGVKMGRLNQKPEDNIGTTTPPNFADTILRKSATGGGIQSTYFLVGPELCLCYNKVKIMPSIKAGLVSNKASNSSILVQVQGIPRTYENSIRKLGSIGWELGVNIAYKVSPNVGMAFSASYLRYSVQAALCDFRNGTAIKNIRMPRSIMNIGVGMYYNLKKS